MSLDFGSAWQQAEVNQGNSSELDPPEPGTYDAVLVGANAFTSQKGNGTVTVDWRVTGGDRDGYEWRDLRTLKSEGAIGACKTMCDRVGVDVDDVASLDELAYALKQHVGEFFEVAVVQNGEYRNTFVNGPATGDRPPATDAPTSPADFAPVTPAALPIDDEDIPF